MPDQSPVSTSALGLVLTGGGARAAYQAGVIHALGNLLASVHQQSFPFPVLVGSSAGAINAAFLAGRADHGLQGLTTLSSFWRQLHSRDVYHLPSTPLDRWSRWATALGLVLSVRSQTAALNNLPLADTLHKTIDLPGIDHALQHQQLQALAITASSYTTGTHWTFAQTTPQHAHTLPDRRGRRFSLQPITIEHLLASSAIPFLFPATPLWVDDGVEYFGDGSMRQLAPLSPAIHLGASRILAIGVGQPTAGQHPPVSERLPPSLGNIAGHALASVFHDSLAADMEQVHRINRVVGQSVCTGRDRLIEVKSIQPSQSLDELAQEHVHQLPSRIRRVLDGLGALKDKGAALSSYLLFEPGFIHALLALGHADAMQRADELLPFLLGQTHPKVP